MALFGLSQRVWTFLGRQTPYSSVSGESDEIIIKKESTPEPESQDCVMPSLDVKEVEKRIANTPPSKADKPISHQISRKDSRQLTRSNSSGGADEGDIENWSEQELDFFDRIEERGSTAMLWTYWKIDFPTIPLELFTAKKEDALIKNWKGLPSIGARAFNTLIQAGCYARELRRFDQDAAQCLYKEINRYIKWSIKDARWKQDTYIPLIVVSYVRKKEDMLVTEVRGKAKIQKLCEQYKQLWQDSNQDIETPLPTIFHILLAKTVMGIESYDCSAEKPIFRNLFITDWRKDGHDLWNAMAVAILVEQCRLWLAKVNPKRKVEKEIIELDPDL